MAKNKSASSLISELKRKTRRTYGSEEKIKIIIVQIGPNNINNTLKHLSRNCISID